MYFHAEGCPQNEPLCYSHFDYEYKNVEKLFESETALKKQRETSVE